MRMIRSNRRGAALVEFTIVLLILMVLVFGIIEFGLLIKDYLTLSQAAREGARSAALGSRIEVIIDRVQETAIGLPGGTIDPADISLQKSSDGGVTWVDLGDTGGSPNENDAAIGQMLRVKLTYDHELVAGGILPFLGDGNTMIISGNMIMRREKTAPPPLPPP